MRANECYSRARLIEERTVKSIVKSTVAALMALLTSGASYASPEVGQSAPDFRLQDQNGEWHTLEQHRGKWVTLYFYPKDDTPGCTKEACAFRDNIFAYDEIGAVILGISLDDVESHEEFAEKYSLPFSILADTDKSTAKAYGVYTKIVAFEMAKRETFLINPDGVIIKHYPKVSPEKHSEEVLGDLQELIAANSDPSG
jgi:peroxiredoxin Q/BCP